MVEHGDAKLTDLASDARRLPEGALGQHPRPLQGGLRTAAVVGVLGLPSSPIAFQRNDASL
jgi:hypothetical protein